VEHTRTLTFQLYSAFNGINILTEITLFFDSGNYNYFYRTRVDHRANRGVVILNGVQINSFPLEGPEWDLMLKEDKFSRSEDPESEYLGDARW